LKFWELVIGSDHSPPSASIATGERQGSRMKSRRASRGVKSDRTFEFVAPLKYHNHNLPLNEAKFALMHDRNSDGLADLKRFLVLRFIATQLRVATKPIPITVYGTELR
jgi:hypothetical protein